LQTSIKKVQAACHLVDFVNNLSPGKPGFFYFEKIEIRKPCNGNNKIEVLKCITSSKTK
jgi:hypothetical protein